MTSGTTGEQGPRVISDHDWTMRVANAVQAIVQRIGTLMRWLLGLGPS